MSGEAMSTQDARNETVQQIQRLQSEVHSLHDQVRLSNIRDVMEDIETTISGFSQRVKDLRNRRYAFERNLENQARSFAPRWTPIKTHVRNEIARQSQSLEKAIMPVESKAARLSGLNTASSVTSAQIRQLEAEVANLKDKASAAERTIQGMYDDLQREVNEFKLHLDRIEEMLTDLEGASFALMTNEAGIQAVKAVLVEGNEDKKDPRGILFLTDQRLLFEQKQEVTKKKVLFIATEKELVQELIMDMPLGMVEEIVTSKKGLFKNEDHIDLYFQSDAPMREAHYHLLGQDCVEWKTKIQRAISGEYDQERAIAIDEEAAAQVMDIPTICPGCGASLQQKVLRGMDSITCQYCGTVIRI